MKYALYFNANSKYDKTADEIIIVYRKRSPGLIEWIKNRPEEQRMVIDITSLEYCYIDDMDIFEEVVKAHPNIAFKISRYDDTEPLKEKDIQFFYMDFIDSWDKLNWAIAAGVSDVYIVNEFAFSLKNIGFHCKKNNVKVRVYPNVAQSNAFNNDNLDCMTKFFIRPEDVVFYEPYVDTFEFFCPVAQQDTYMGIYLRQNWTTNLSFIIKGFDKDVISAQLVRFGVNRLDCEKRCAYGQCSICKRSLDISMLLRDAQIGLVKKEPVKHYTKEEAYDALRELSMIKETAEEQEKIIQTLTNEVEEIKDKAKENPYD